MNTDLAAQQSIFDSTVELTTQVRGKELIETVYSQACLAGMFLNLSGLEVLRISEQALRSAGCVTEAAVIKAHYRAEIEQARHD